MNPKQCTNCDRMTTLADNCVCFRQEQIKEETAERDEEKHLDDMEHATLPDYNPTD